MEHDWCLSKDRRANVNYTLYGQEEGELPPITKAGACVRVDTWWAHGGQSPITSDTLGTGMIISARSLVSCIKTK